MASGKPLESNGHTRLLTISLDREEIPLIKAAMDKLGELAQRDDLDLTRDEALALMDSNAKDNYYLWALGAAGLAVRNDKPASEELYRRWLSDRSLLPSPRQIVWLDYCFGELMSEGMGPDRAARHDMLIDYLKRIPDKAAATGASSRP